MSGSYGEYGYDFEEMFRIDFTEDDIEELRRALEEMVGPVDIDLFLDETGCLTCIETEKLLKIIEENSPMVGDRRCVNVRIHRLSKDKDIFTKFGVDRIPTILLLNGAIRYIGMPAGEEIKGFIETLIRISTGDHGLSPTTVSELANLGGRVDIEVIVTPPCPYCPYAALMANMFAYVSHRYGQGNVRSIIVEAFENPDIADRYFVTTVPTIVINGRVVFVGLPYEAQLLEAVKRFSRAAQ